MGELERLLSLTKRPFPLLPEIVKTILEIFLTKTERELFEFIEKTSEFKTLIISVANLPEFRKDNPEIIDLRKAILVLGEDFIKTLVLCYLSLKLKKTTFNEFSFDLFWARAIANLCFSNLISSHLPNYSEHLHITSYFMDYGIILLYLISPEGYLQVLKLKKIGKSTIDAEREVFGVDHSVVGAEYFENYGFPRRFVLNLLHHHRIQVLPEELPQYIINDIQILSFINSAVGSYFSIKREEKFRNFQETGKILFGTSEENFFIALLDALPSFVNPFLKILGYKDYILVPYTQLLKEEKEREIQEEIQKIEKKKKEQDFIKLYKEEIAKLLREKSNLIKTIDKLEKELKIQTIFDPLTGLYNEEYFKRRLQEEILRARRYNRIFSVMLLEIEDLPDFITKFDKKEEEEILKKLSTLFLSKLRRVDIVAKFNNPERFGIILPETPLSGGMVVARKLLNLVEKFFYENYKISNKSIFISLLSYEPKEIKHKHTPKVEILLKTLEKGLEILKERKQKRVISLVIDREIEL